MAAHGAKGAPVMTREQEEAEIRRMQRINRIGARTIVAMAVLAVAALIYAGFH